MRYFVGIIFVAQFLLRYTESEQTREFTIVENVPTGTLVGLLDDPDARATTYLIVPSPGSAVDSDLLIDQATKEIRTRVVLDRELRNSYTFVAIPSDDGENIRVLIRVKDENDNAPKFVAPSMSVEFPENTPRDVKRTLNPARDSDLGIFNVQQYKIVSGNTNNAFRLSSHRERDEVLYLDLQVNGFLDRETTPFYRLVIDAYDGGNPKLKGSMTVNVTIVDVNDNQPIFNQSRYFASVPENVTVGTNVVQLFASDMDEGDNGRVSYYINRRQSDRERFFEIDRNSGIVSVNKGLDFETKDVYELVVVARDGGAQPLETTTFVTLRVLDVNDNRPTINLIFLSDDASPKVSEDAQPGKLVARISVNDPDSKTEYSDVNVTLEGGGRFFGLRTRDHMVYFLYVESDLDREIGPNFTLSVTATDQGQPPLQVSRSFVLHVTDVNDHVPRFTKNMYFASVQETADPGTSVAQLTAMDADEGNNSLVSYSIRDTPDTRSQWFEIDAKTGLITTKSHVDCETDAAPRVVVVASDAGSPPLSSSVTLTITILDVNDNEPIFDQSYYHVAVNESVGVGHCLLTISATDADCGVNGMVNYTLDEERTKEFLVQPLTGKVCVNLPLDHETRSTYEFPVLATDRGGESTSAMVKIQVTDINDNSPIFYPREYNVSLRENVLETVPIVIIVATDADSGAFGTVTYRIVSGNVHQLFRIDSTTGELFMNERLNKRNAMHHLTVSAVDGGGRDSQGHAHIWVSVIDSHQRPPTFKHSRYNLSIREDAPIHSDVGIVRAITSDRDAGNLHYSIYSGDPNGYFSIEPQTGRISTNKVLDHEKHPFILLNVQAQSGRPPSYGHTQVNISINDVNDNAPEFASHIVRISVSENSSPNTLLYTAHASDPDSGENGTIIYELIHNPENSFIIDPLTGRTTLRTKLDYEKSNEYSVIVGASDRGREPLRSNMTLKIQVQDVNDNAPIFAKPVYDVNVIESEAVNAQLVQVKASDADSGNNARLTYKLETSEHAGVFGVFPNNGWVYLKRSLDREQRDAYRLVIVARDNGSPVMSATCTVELKVGDVNDNDPQFPKESYVFAVEENADTGSRVGRIRAGDKDAANNGAVRYGLGLNATYFKINHMTGEIVTTSKLDREWKAVHDFVATATDGGTPPRNAQVRVQVKVNDVNDNPPIFIDPYDDIITVREEGAPGTEFVRVSASDPDAGFNGTVSYFLDKANGEDSWDVFDIDSETGVMSTKLVLDQELKQMYRVTIIAKDGGTPPLESRKELKIEVVDSNDNRPIFSASSFDFHVPENTSAGERIGSVAAHDTDDGRITYNIANGNLYDTFEINKTSGTLFLAHEVDYEKTSHFVLQIRAVDASTSNLRESLINLTLTIDDVNDNAPVFEKDPILLKLAEDVLEGSVVWNFSAVDADGGVNGLVSYAILHQSPEKAFRVDETTGALTVVKTLDYELHPEYMLVMAATDRADDPNRRLSTSATARIILVDVNDNAPYFTSRSRIDVMEDEPIGYPIVHLIALDRDSGDNGKITYGIASGNEAGYFALDPLTGLLTLAKRIDREVSTRYVLNVTATDNGVPALSTHQLIDVFIEDLDDNPPRFERSVYLTNISEDASVGSLVVKLKAIDPDSGTNVNLTYFIPSGIADEKFVIDPITGEMRTNAKMDREDKSSYTVTVYVRDGSLPTQYDTATVLVDLIDINDNYPEFHDSCYPLSVPENSELSVIHNVVAMDRDAGLNGDVSYTITKGNVGNKFSIDPQTGQLASAPLDREVVSIYRLTITARDRGNPPQYGSCNVTIHVEDQNDNDPRFLQNRYETRIPEDAAINTTVLVVKASDADEGVNARITYSLSNETQWLFKIDSETGVITTSGVFDREKKASYSFEVRATDGGKYDARSEKTLVVVTITDVNDNKPLFQKYPMNVEVPSNMPPGSLVLTVVANDKDLGKNSEIIYSFVGDHRNKFRIDPDTGQVVVVGSLAADSGKFYHIEVLAQDKGNPPLSSTGVIEIRVGDNTGASVLKFQNSTYRVRLLENAPLGQEVVRVVAVRNDGKQSGIMYSFGNGNEDDTFDIDPTTGVISVKDSRRLDYEMTQRLKLIVVAHADTLLPMYGYATVRIDLIDQNDNPPRFTQDRYVSSVWEGQNKGTFVMQVSASDEDSGSYGSIVYHIVDGNHDNAFVIEPPFSGIVKTNIVLDREIRDVYRITIIATDEGGPHLTGTCTLRINIIDVNDNQPTFPPHNEVNVTEGADVGSLVTTITANDVDTNPALTYSFAQDGNPDQMFSIDRYSGKITLSQLLDHEAKSQYRLTVEASDTTHVARTTLIVNVVDENDNPPVFSQQSYQVTLSEMTEPGYAVITVNATDNDTGENAKIMYSMGIAPVDGFYINENTGEIFTNKTISFDPTQPTIQLVITARDHGRPSLAAVVAVRIQVTDLNNVEPKFLQQIYTTRIVENTPRGTTVVRVKAADFEQTQQSHRLVYYIITSGNEERKFEINSNTGDIILVNQLDREMRALYTLHVTARDRNYPSHNATAEVLIYVEDINDNSPVFNQSDYVINVSEKVRIGQQLVKVYALDPDDGDNAKVKYDITSGNIQGMFELKRDTGVVVVRKPLDYEKVREYKLVVRAVDNHPDKPLTGIATVHVNVEDENDNAPEFPVFQYLEFVEENVPIGSPVFTARAYDSDKGMYGKVNYSITDGDGKHKFLVEPHTGLVTTNYVFDFETRNRYHFIIKARDAGGKFATARVQVDVESKDEFAPEFTLGSYQYTVPSSAQANYMVGRVQATDKDKGPDGRVVYTLREPHPNFRVNRTTGLITVKGPLKKPQQQLREGPNILLVTASSGRPNSLTSTAEVLIVVDYYKNGTELGAANEEASTGLAGWALGLVVALTILAASLFTVIVFLRLRSRRCGKPALAHEFESSFDTIDIRPPPTTSNVSSRFPPHYNDLHHYDTADANCCGNLTSGVSDQSHSASSGRGSAEEGDDGDDEEIRMINEQPLIQQKLRERLGMPDSGIQHDDEDNSSDISVRNTQEYLARLGIDTTRKVPQSMESMHMFDDEGGGEGDITNLIYAKLNEVGADDMKFANESMTGSLSSIVHSEEELTGSYNWDYLLDWGPRYQPLAHVFAEIARLKDDTVAHNNHHHHHHRKNNIKSVPPPLLTAVAPRSIAPVALNRTSQMASLCSLPRSPISHDSSLTSLALSPSFSPSLSPLATRSPSISPLVTPIGGNSSSDNSTSRHSQSQSQRSSLLTTGSSGSETELQI